MADLEAARRSLSAFCELVAEHPLTGFQAAALEELGARTTAIVAPRQSGKSRSLALLAAHWAFKNANQRVLIVSAGDEAAKRLLAQIRGFVSGSSLLRGSVVDESQSLIVLSNGSEIRSVPASERQVRGWSVDLLLIDEAAIVPDDLILGAAVPTTAARKDARIVLASSATAASGAFYDAVQRGRRRLARSTVAFSWPLAEAWWISPATVEAARESMSPVRFAAEYEGVFASSADAVFPRHVLDAATAPIMVPGFRGLSSPAGLWGGVDWGATVDRSALVAVGRLLAPAGVYVVVAAHAWPSGTLLGGLGGVVDQVAACPARWRSLTLETNGLGLPVSQDVQRRLYSRGNAVVNLRHTSADMKSAAYSALRLMMEEQRLVIPAGCGELLRELLLLRAVLLPAGGERIEAAGAGHDDLADALMLASGPAPPVAEGGAWRCALRDAALGEEPVTVGALGDDTVTSGGGLVLPRVAVLDELPARRPRGLEQESVVAGLDGEGGGSRVSGSVRRWRGTAFDPDARSQPASLRRRGGMRGRPL